MLNSDGRQLKRDTLVDRIPVTIWGSPSARVIVAVHGYFSSRADPVIEVLAEATSCQVVSFDLPGHGSRTLARSHQIWPAEALDDVNRILDWAFEKWSEVSLFAVSMGAYLSLLAGADRPVRHAWLLAPVTDLLAMTTQSMERAGVTVEQLREAGTVAVPEGEDLSWEYYSFASSTAPTRWPHSTETLHAATDDTVPVEHSIAFADRFGAELTVLPDGEHWFHTSDQLRQLSTWLHHS